VAADDDDRTEEPTQRKIEQAREKGDIIYSQEVGTALSLLAATSLVAFMAGPILTQTAHGFIAFPCSQTFAALGRMTAFLNAALA